MSILPTQLGRVSDLLQMSVADQSISTTQAQLLTVQNELSTGKQVNQPSDNPSAAATILSLQKILAQRQSYSDNINNGQTQLSQVGTTLSSLSNLLLQAQNIASADVGSTVTDQQRQGDAQVVNSLITEAQSLANTQSDGVYLFGGDNGNQSPYVSADGGVQFVGSTNLIENTVAQNTLMPSQISGASVFGGLSSSVTGSANLTPSVTAQTQLSSLSGVNNNGINLGTIQLSNGTVTKTIDLSHAQTLGDVVSAINSAGVGSITATLTTTGITLSSTASTDNITVTDSTGTAASDLGIATSSSGAGAGNPVVGGALNPTLTPFTPLSTLNGGAGLDTSGIIITNGSQSKTITFPPGGDVQSMLNAINGAGLGVVASINSAGTGINVQNAVQGTTMTIGENGGSTATELGIRSFSPSSSLSELNSGQGVGTAPSGSSGDFTITGTTGASFTVSIAGANTVQDVINDINTAATAAGVSVTAGFATTGNGITLTDTGGGSGALSVAAINGSTAATDLGLTAPASSTATSITGADVDGVQTAGIFTDLQNLANALQSGNQDAITAAAQNLQTDYTNATNANGVAGARVQELQNFSSQLTSENIATQQLLSNIQDTNMTSAISEFQTLQTALQAALQTTAESQSVTLLNYLDL